MISSLWQQTSPSVGQLAVSATSTVNARSASTDAAPPFFTVRTVPLLQSPKGTQLEIDVNTDSITDTHGSYYHYSPVKSKFNRSNFLSVVSM